jgi:MinD-like ATPase involved in chromosome partitioning or flagellar assembly
MSKVIMGLNGKGGVGKSTIMSLIAPMLDAILYNIDQTQSVEDVNAGEFSFDLIEENLNLKSYISEAKEDYEFVVIDTPSNMKPEQTDFKRVISIIDEVDLFIIPLKEGKRSISTTLDTISLFFGKGLKGRVKPIKLFFILNDIKMTGLKKETLEAAKSYIHNNIIDELKNIEFQVEVEAIFINYLMNSRAIKTLEDRDITLEQLYQENKGAYRPIKAKALELSDDIKNILKGE